MKFAEILDPNLLRIDAYSADSFRIGGHEFPHSVLLLPGASVQPWPVPSATGLTAAHLDPFLLAHPQLILIGAGSGQHLPAPSLMTVAAEHRIGIEWMPTGAACRTYNLLISEGRRVAAGIFLASL